MSDKYSRFRDRYTKKTTTGRTGGGRTGGGGGGGGGGGNTQNTGYVQTGQQDNYWNNTIDNALANWNQ